MKGIKRKKEVYDTDGEKVLKFLEDFIDDPVGHLHAPEQLKQFDKPQLDSMFKRLCSLS